VSQLSVRDLSASYDYMPVLHGVSLTVGRGEAVCLLGANGAGKSTTLRAVSGVAPRFSGEVELEGSRLDRLRPHKRVRAGLGHVPERQQIFEEMTVTENLEVGSFIDPQWRKHRKKRMDMVHDLFPVLRDRPSQKAGTLSGGERQMLAIGRALMSGPRYLLLDEPSLGLAPVIVNNLYEALKELTTLDTGVLLVEQMAEKALSLGSRGYVLYQGRIVQEGTSAELISSKFVSSGYTDVSELDLEAA
jgi:branched-chain amino acid transport system ATP-binding protein